MFSYQWVNLLGNYGDPVEKIGISECGLGESFPKYAELWGKYVLTNRNPLDASKLRSDLEPEKQDVINNHYGVFHQLTIGILQLQNLDNPLLDVASPLYHLATAIDLTERTFVFAHRAKTHSSLIRFEKPEFENKVQEFWEKTYPADCAKYDRDFYPVVLRLHTIETEFIKLTKDFPERKEFREVSIVIRHYRNVLIHSLPPLKLTDGSQTYIPKPDFIKDISSRWSSEQDKGTTEKYGPAKEVITNLADRLLSAMNSIWDRLISDMTDLFPMDEFELFKRVTAAIPATQSGESPYTSLRPSGMHFLGNDPNISSDPF